MADQGTWASRADSVAETRWRLIRKLGVSRATLPSAWSEAAPSGLHADGNDVLPSTLQSQQPSCAPCLRAQVGVSCVSRATNRRTVEAGCTVRRRGPWVRRSVFACSDCSTHCEATPSTCFDGGYSVHGGQYISYGRSSGGCLDSSARNRAHLD